MKVYRCDSCGTSIEHAHSARMKEFDVGTLFDCGMALPTQMKNRKRVHLCNTCFKGLRSIAEKFDTDHGWISVKDRLPTNEYLDCMLVLKVGDSYEIDCGGWTRSIGSCCGKEVERWGWWVNNDWDEGQGCVVQYWMPYPSLPKDIELKLISGYRP